jgi:hypothetical protein
LHRDAVRTAIRGNAFDLTGFFGPNQS